MEKQLIIVAGGQGKRMKSEIPKQFLVIARKPLLMHTIERFQDFSSELKIFLVLPESHFEFWKSLCKKYDFNISHQLVKGGKTRFHSVKNGLDEINEECIVAIHDGVRPLVSHSTIASAFALAEKKGNAIPVVGINESMRKVKHKKSTPVNREKFRLVQTPQCFNSILIKEAYAQGYREEFTDDATVVEALGIKVRLTKGNSENIKITRPVDLKIAEAFLHTGS
jgi:2-C-methyl-D-erythritol 4-phosphate cytidylyltransferase